MRQKIVAPVTPTASVIVTGNVGFIVEVVFGIGVYVSTGATVSTVHMWLAGVGSRVPKLSTARTWKVCKPSARLAVVCGDVHAAKASASTLHSKPAITRGCVVVPVNENVGVESFDGFGGFAVIDVSGLTDTLLDIAFHISVPDVG
jgi:hypothetical protein